MARLPRVKTTAPAETHNKEEQATGEKKTANEVEVLELLHLASTLVLHVESGRVVEEEVEGSTQSIDYDHQVIAPSPSGRCI